MTDRPASSAPRLIRSELRGRHWVSWLPDADGKPEGAVVLVGRTKEEAEKRAREWAGQAARQ